MKTFSDFRDAFALARAKGADWRARALLGGIAMNRASPPSPSAPDAAPVPQEEDFSDLIAALDDVVAGRSMADPDAIALRAAFGHGRYRS